MTFIFYIIASICFFISAVLKFMDNGNMLLAIFPLSLCVCFLILSLVYYKKDKENNN